jgi:hypothetical protein
MAVGLLGIGIWFLTAPKDIQEVENILFESHGDMVRLNMRFLMLLAIVMLQRKS